MLRQNYWKLILSAVVVLWAFNTGRIAGLDQVLSRRGLHVPAASAGVTA